MPKIETDSDYDKELHVRLNKYDREALAFMRANHGVSAAGAVRMCIRAAARQLGFGPAFNNIE